MQRDIYNNVSTVQSLAPAARTATANGASADMVGFHGGCLIQINAGAWTDGSHTFEVQDSDDNSTFTAVADQFIQGTEPVVDAAADGGQVYELGYIGAKRYVRVVATVATATSGAVYGANIVRAFPRNPSTR